MENVARPPPGGKAFPGAIQADPMGALQGKAPRLGQIIEATSHRRDTGELRAKLVLLLLRARCPVGATPRRSWYEPGAVTRLGLAGLGRLWETAWQEPAPSRRTLQRHLAALEGLLVLVRAPGEWIPTQHREKPVRFPDTFHVLEDEPSAVWWADTGCRLLEEHPEARRDLRAWRHVIGDWREKPRRRQGLLFANLVHAWSSRAGPTRAELRQVDAEQLRELALRLAAGTTDRLEPTEATQVLRRLDAVGIKIEGAARFQVTARRHRLAGVLALLARSLHAGGSTIHNRAGWLVGNLRRCSDAELAGALGRIPRKLEEGLGR